MGERINFSVENGIARITLVNPKGYNVMDLPFCQELGKAAIACETNPDIKVILIDAEGDVFSMGGDIHSFVDNKDRVHAHVLNMVLDQTIDKVKVVKPRHLAPMHRDAE